MKRIEEIGVQCIKWSISSTKLLQIIRLLHVHLRNGKRNINYQRRKFLRLKNVIRGSMIFYPAKYTMEVGHVTTYAAYDMHTIAVLSILYWSFNFLLKLYSHDFISFLIHLQIVRLCTFDPDSKFNWIKNAHSNNFHAVTCMTSFKYFTG